MPDDTLIKRLEDHLPDQFARDLLKGALGALTQENIATRAQHFSVSMRDLSDHMLKQLAPDDPEILNSYDSIGNAYLRAGQPERALDLMKKAVDGAAKTFGEKHVKTAHYIKNLGTAYGMQRNFVEAAALTERAVRIEAALYPPGSPDVVNGLNNLGNMQLTLGRLADAQKTLDEARARNRGADHDESLGQTFVLGNLARVHEARGDLAGAAELLDEARATATKVVGPDHARTVTLDLQAARVGFMRDPKTAAALEKVASAIVAAPEKLAQFRARSEPEARYALGLAEDAGGDRAKAGATWRLLRHRGRRGRACPRPPARAHGRRGIQGADSSRAGLAHRGN